MKDEKTGKRGFRLHQSFSPKVWRTMISTNVSSYCCPKYQNISAKFLNIGWCKCAIDWKAKAGCTRCSSTGLTLSIHPSIAHKMETSTEFRPMTIVYNKMKAGHFFRKGTCQWILHEHFGSNLGINSAWQDKRETLQLLSSFCICQEKNRVGKNCFML